MRARQRGRLAVTLLLLAALSPARADTATAPPPWPAALQQALAQDAHGANAGTDRARTDRARTDSTRTDSTGTNSAATLHSFFRRHADALNLFCADTCTALKPRQQQLQRFFRGSYAALPDGMATAAAKPELADVYAAHAAAYFTDANYRCRHPLTAAQLESVWQFAAAPQACPARIPFMVLDDEGRRELRWIDPARVHAVHLVFAGASGGTLSRFGHVALRLVLCGEHRQRVDAGCEEDLFDHLSFGFMAGIDELDLSLWKGISGGYPVKLYARRFISTYRDYSIDEFRSLHSLPLRLEPGAMDLMVRALAQVHWSYQNEYRFFTRNCATELQWLLQAVHQAAGSGAQTFLTTNRYRPDRLFADARQSHHFDGALLDDPQQAEKGGYFFPGAEAYYQVAVNVFRDHPGPAPYSRPQTPEDWRLRPALLRRNTILLPALQEDTGAPARPGAAGRTGAAHTAQAGLVLEAWVARRLRREILAALTTYYGTLLQELIGRDAFFTAEEKMLVEECMVLIKTGDQTGTVARGVPQEAPATVPAAAACDVGSPALVAVMKRLYDEFPVHAEHRQQIRELEDTAENIRLLGQRPEPS